MDLQKGLDLIKEYFDRVDAEQLHEDLVACGLYEIKSLADDGVEFANCSEEKPYKSKSTQFKFKDECVYSAYKSELAEAA